MAFPMDSLPADPTSLTAIEHTYHPAQVHVTLQRDQVCFVDPTRRDKEIGILSSILELFTLLW